MCVCLGVECLWMWACEGEHGCVFVDVFVRICVGGCVRVCGRM